MFDRLRKLVVKGAEKIGQYKVVNYGLRFIFWVGSGIATAANVNAIISSLTNITGPFKYLSVTNVAAFATSLIPRILVYFKPRLSVSKGIKNFMSSVDTIMSLAALTLNSFTYFFKKTNKESPAAQAAYTMAFTLAFANVFIALIRAASLRAKNTKKGFLNYFHSLSSAALNNLFSVSEFKTFLTNAGIRYDAFKANLAMLLLTYTGGALTYAKAMSSDDKNCCYQRPGCSKKANGAFELINELSIGSGDVVIKDSFISSSTFTLIEDFRKNKKDFNISQGEVIGTNVYAAFFAITDTIKKPIMEGLDNALYGEENLGEKEGLLSNEQTERSIPRELEEGEGTVEEGLEKERVDNEDGSIEHRSPQ